MSEKTALFRAKITPGAQEWAFSATNYGQKGLAYHGKAVA
jgi:hypothetical protein